MISVRFSSLRTITPREYAVRLLFGGACTTLAGLIAKHFGPVVGGLFLAFPAIFPASASLIEEHEQQRKQKSGMNGQKRGRAAVSIDSAGASLGAIGLAAFALTVWLGLPHLRPLADIALATLAWALVSVALWLLRSKHPLHRAPGRASARLLPRV